MRAWVRIDLYFVRTGTRPATARAERPGLSRTFAVGSIFYLLLGCASVMGVNAAVDQTVGIGTDVAGLFVYHPDDLQHRATSPSDWLYTDFACNREFNNGT